MVERGKRMGRAKDELNKGGVSTALSGYMTTTLRATSPFSKASIATFTSSSE
jgi:hypothetical protein